MPYQMFSNPESLGKTDDAMILHKTMSGIWAHWDSYIRQPNLK